MGEQDTRRKIVISISRKTCLRVGVAAFLLYVAITWWRPLLGLLGRAVKASAPLFIGIALAYMVNILMSVYEKHYFRRHADQAWVIKTRRAVCLIGAIATVLGAAVLLLGIVLPQCSIGTLIEEGFNNITILPYQILPPIIVLALLMLGFNFIGDGLREALAPKLEDM